MSSKTGSKDPIENWRFEAVVDNKALPVLAASANGPVKLRDRFITFGKAFENARIYLESSNFLLLEDGSLIAQPTLASLPSYILQIDVTEAFNLGALAGFREELSARKTKQDFNPWHVTGWLKSNPKHSENLVLDDRGNLYFHDRRKSWESSLHHFYDPRKSSKSILHHLRRAFA